uniref:Uncharacterized protein n=1 Tax=Steinernema glaseri TaxID=37863 RepID=A0A1I8ATN4_9BILA
MAGHERTMCNEHSDEQRRATKASDTLRNYTNSSTTTIDRLDSRTAGPPKTPPTTDSPLKDREEMMSAFLHMMCLLYSCFALMASCIA